MRIFRCCINLPTGNFGDDALTLATKRRFETIFPGVKWVEFPVRHLFTKTALRVANDCDMVLVGPGGLFLADTVPNSPSGWQWAIPLQRLAALKPPIVVFAAGYNRFRGQDKFPNIFKLHVNALKDKAAFFSVRSSGSKRALVDGHGVDPNGLWVCPCPSIFSDIRHLRTPPTKLRVGINLAGDRMNLRVSDYGRFKAEVAEAVDTLVDAGAEIYWFNHNWSPERNCQDIIDYCDTGHEVLCNTNWSAEDIGNTLLSYTKMSVVIAMRGHAQMIPFGLGVPTVGLVSHDKLRWFGEDTDTEDMLVEADEPNLGMVLAGKALAAATDPEWHERNEVAYRKLCSKFNACLDQIKEVGRG